MGKRLVIAEKPMLAKAILDAIPGTANISLVGLPILWLRARALPTPSSREAASAMLQSRLQATLNRIPLTPPIGPHGIIHSSL